MEQTKMGTLFVLLAGMLWGTSGLFVRYFTTLGTTTMQQTFFKVAVAGTIMLLYCALFHRDCLKIK